MAFGLNALPSRSVRLGLLRYHGIQNLGDEIQSVAARQFLPRVDALVDRDALDRRPSLLGKVHLIVNGWLTLRPDRWPPHHNIRPLFLSIHLSDQPGLLRFSAAEALVVGENAHYLRRHGPIGARDLWTLDLLQRNAIESYFSGCLTLTLDRPAGIERGDYVIANDLNDDIVAAIRRRTELRVITTTHMVKYPSGFSARIAEAERLLRLYAGAACVLTSRLHCALPCLAMETPVLLLPEYESSKRLTGLASLMHVSTPATFIADKAGFDLSSPPANPDGHLPLRNALAEKCRSFIHNALRGSA